MKTNKCLKFTGAWWAARVIDLSSIIGWEALGDPLVSPHEARVTLKHNKIVATDISGVNISPPNNTNGLASKFAQIKTLEDINIFANKYGLLGVLGIPSSVDNNPRYEKDVAWETLDAWEYHIKQVRRLLSLYSDMQKLQLGYDVEIIGKHLLIEEYPLDGCWLLRWDDRKSLGLIHRCQPSLNGQVEGAMMLAYLIQSSLKGGIDLDYSHIVPAENAAIGYRIVEQRTTPYLLAAIYYDLWELITDNRPVTTCTFCGLPFERVGRQKYCNDSCKQAAYRRRNNIPPVVKTCGSCGATMEGNKKYCSNACRQAAYRQRTKK